MTLSDCFRIQTIRACLFQFVGAPGSLRASLIKNTGGTFFLKVAATCLGFLTTLLFTRVLGAAEYGAYAYAMVWVGLLSVPATLGFHQLLVRNVAIYHMQEEWGLLRGLLRFSNQLVLILSITLMAIAGLISWMQLGSKENDYMLLIFWMALLILPFSALTQLRQAAMRGFHQIILGQLPEMLILPVLYLFMFGFGAILFRQHLTAQLAVALYVVATVITFVIGLYWLNKIRPVETKTANPQFCKRTWLGGAFPLMVIAGIQLINFQADVIFLGAYQDTEKVGIYVVTKQLAGLIIFGLIAVEMSIAPSIATLYRRGQISKLQRMISKSTAALIGISIPIILLLTIFGENVLLLFGTEFVDGLPTLIVLCVGQLINVGFGPIGQIAIHTGHEKNTAVIVGFGALLNVTLNMILIPDWGMIGAATATAISLACWNAVLAIYIYKRTGIVSGPFYFIRKRF